MHIVKETLIAYRAETQLLLAYINIIYVELQQDTFFIGLAHILAFSQKTVYEKTVHVNKPINRPIYIYI